MLYYLLTLLQDSAAGHGIEGAERSEHLLAGPAHQQGGAVHGGEIRGIELAGEAGIHGGAAEFHFHDHLDYHRTVEAYLKAKKSFFDGLTPQAFALVNADDRNGAVMLQNCLQHVGKGVGGVREVHDGGHAVGTAELLEAAGHGSALPA